MRKRINHWVTCFVLGYLESRQEKFDRDSMMYMYYDRVISDVKGEYKYR